MLLVGMASPASAHAPHDVLSCETEKQPVNIPSMPLARAIEILGRQSGCPILVDPILMDGRTSAAVKGAYTPQAALLHLFGSVHVDVTATVSGLSVSPLDATALTSGDTRADQDRRMTGISPLSFETAHTSLKRSAAKPQEPMGSRAPA
ncbi:MULTISPECIES: hypothetical protein [Gluconobacter]|nr:MULTISPECIES: hypothetical protein [Gluconobacter]